MPISWNEIRQNAIAFSKDWAGESREDAEAKTFWDEFFTVFGLKRRTVASFEEPVKKLNKQYGFIDLFWKGMLLVEHKARGKSLEKAHSQAVNYIQALKSEGRDEEIPRYIIVSDFAKIALHDLEAPESKEGMFPDPDSAPTIEFSLQDFHQSIHYFAFIPGYKQHKLVEQDPINIEAVELLGDLHDALEDGGYGGHDLERFMVRVLFCLFAEDTGLFERNVFTDFIDNHTEEDGSDLGANLARLFNVLNKPEDKRQKNLLEELVTLPYVNGDLFAENLGFADLNRDMRNRLLTCCRFDWSRISPAIFGSLFQSIMEPKERRQIGAHYTSERDILKLVRSLFLDDLKAEFDSIKTNKKKLEAFHEKLGKLMFLDPACGCGNFLVVTYRELRLLEIEVLKALYGTQRVTDIRTLSVVNVDAFYGIEIEEFPAQIAQVAMWLVDHQMNQALSNAFGQYFRRLPLTKSATIRHANALRIDWNDVLPAEKCSYVMGNPPFVGKSNQTSSQEEDMQFVTGHLKGSGLLDYVAAWYIKAIKYIKNTPIQVSFVSTNSIVQGEQVGVLWSYLFSEGASIAFAHRTFEWESEARGKAHVHVVIIGMSIQEKTHRYLFDYDGNKQSPVRIEAARISPYLIEGTNTVIRSSNTPISDAPRLVSGNKPVENGNYLFTTEKKVDFIQKEPNSKRLFRRWVGSVEFINGIDRWCLFLLESQPNELQSMPEVMKRIAAVRQFRQNSKKAATRKLADRPTRFEIESVQNQRYLLIPAVSSIRRPYVPIDFMTPDTIASNLCNILPNARLFDFAIVSSRMHMSWVRVVCGRLKSDYRYSVNLVYNNFPWPENPSEKQKAAVEARAQAVLDARAKHPDATLADLYDPLTMPPELQRAHAELDRAVELCYRKEPFRSDRERVEYLFGLYEKLTSPLTAGIKEKKVRRKR